jgi:hypothetical protein
VSARHPADHRGAHRGPRHPENPASPEAGGGPAAHRAGAASRICLGCLQPLIFSQGRDAPAPVVLWVTCALVPRGMHPIPGHAHAVLDDDLPPPASMRDPLPRINCLTGGHFVCYKVFGAAPAPAPSIIALLRGTQIRGAGGWGEAAAARGEKRGFGIPIRGISSHSPPPAAACSQHRRLPQHLALACHSGEQQDVAGLSAAWTWRSRWGTVCESLAEREHGLSGKPQDICLVTQSPSG